MTKQDLINMICDRCDAKTIFSGQQDPGYKQWGWIDITIKGGRNIGVFGSGTGSGNTSHLCPDCCKSILAWWDDK